MTLLFWRKMLQLFWCTKYILLGAEGAVYTWFGLSNLHIKLLRWLWIWLLGYFVRQKTIYFLTPSLTHMRFFDLFSIETSIKFEWFFKSRVFRVLYLHTTIAKVMFFALNTFCEEKILLSKILIENFLQVALPTSIQRLGRMRSGAVVEEVGDRRPSVRESQRSSSVVENILEISSEVTRAPSLEEEGVSRRRTTVVAEL